jgi:hypothetical protein
MADTLPSDLAKIDPAEAWAAAKPTWNAKWIGHLYRRAAFGPSPADIKQALADGFEKTLDRLIGGEPDAPALLEVLVDSGRYLKADTQLRAWWLSAMLEGKHPLREKLTLFWHNHFATSYAKVQRTQLMFEQNLLLRTYALGKFRPFLLAMSRDTAMLKWLDSNQNIKGAPNENFAREVMELFSLGVGHYTEKDIQEAARAFTGWHTDSRIETDEDTFQFKPVLHDDGSKTVFGRTGNWNGDDIITFCCDRPDCARFLVGKLYAFLISETRPPEKLLEPLAERFRKSDYDIADLVKAMLGSRLFFSEHAYRKRVKWPVEYALGAVRATVPGRVPLGDLIDPLAKMGQVLFAPPNVKGWRTGTDWLNSATLLARNNFAEMVAMGTWPRSSTRGPSPAFSADAATATAVEDLAVPLPAPMPVEGFAAVSGATVAVAVPTIAAPDGKLYIVPKLSEVPPDPPGPGASSGPPPKMPPPAEAPAPNPDLAYDTTAPLFQPPPKNAAELVKRMADALYGEPVSAAAKSRIEKFLLDGKASLAAKDMDNPAFRAKVREALHALMCLPEYQLN